MALATNWTVDCAPMSFVHVVPGCACVIKAMDHVSLVNVWEVLLLQDLDVQVLSAFQLSL